MTKTSLATLNGRVGALMAEMEQTDRETGVCEAIAEELETAQEALATASRAPCRTKVAA